MHSLTCFSGSLFSRGERSKRFDRVSTSVARIALDECLLLGKSGALSDADKRRRVVDLCAYAARQKGMVERGYFNHRIHPDFELLATAVDGAIKGNAGSQWLLAALDKWPDDEADKRQFWDSVKIALLAQKKNDVGTELAQALGNDPASAATALQWLLPADPDLIEAWKANAKTSAQEVAQHIECKLGIRKYAEGAFDWLGKAKQNLKPATLLQRFDDLVLKATTQEGIGEIVAFLADTPLKEKDLDGIVNAIVEANYAHGTTRAMDLNAAKASARADVKAWIELCLGVLAENRNGARRARERHWLTPNWLAEKILEREAANWNFIADGLAAFLGKPDLRGDHPMSGDFASSLKNLGKSNPALADKFLRAHFPLIDVHINAKLKKKNSKKAFLALWQMAKKLEAWAGKNPSFGELHTCLKSATRAHRAAATYYLRQQGLSAAQVEALSKENDRGAFDSSLYGLLARQRLDQRWQDRLQRIGELTVASSDKRISTDGNLGFELVPAT
jgi:hypothetical protein